MDIAKYLRESARGIGVSLSSVDEADVARLSGLVLEAKRVFVAGAGRTLLMMKAFAMGLMQVGIEVHVVGDVSTPGIREGDLLLLGSRSGESAVTVLFAEKARRFGARMAVITSRRESTLGRMGDLCLWMDADSEPDSFQATWISDSRFEQSIVPLGDCVRECVAAANGATADTMNYRHANLE